jgi:hypothetical protein
MIAKGWNSCVINYADPFDEKVQEVACDRAFNESFATRFFVPKETETNESEQDAEFELNSEDEERDELDIMQEIAVGSRRSTRVRQQAQRFGYTLDSSYIEII